MSDIDHKAEAEAILFADRQYRDVRTLAEAQVSATLYLAEQQAATVEQLRLANLIALFRLEEADVADLATRGVIWPQVSAEIVEALGLA